MFKKIILSGAMGAALVVGVAGCSQNEVARPGTVVDDLFAPTSTTAVNTVSTSTTTTAVPAIPVAEPEITTYAVPEPQVQVVGSSSSLISQPISAPAPQIISAPAPAPQFVTAPQPALLPPPSGGFEAPLAPPSFDCEELPTSKTSLVQYRKNCL